MKTQAPPTPDELERQSREFSEAWREFTGKELEEMPEERSISGYIFRFPTEGDLVRVDEHTFITKEALEEASKEFVDRQGK